MKSFDTNILILSITDDDKFQSVKDSISTSYSCIIVRSIEEEFKRHSIKIISGLHKLRYDFQIKKIDSDKLSKSKPYLNFKQNYESIGMFLENYGFKHINALLKFLTTLDFYLRDSKNYYPTTMEEYKNIDKDKTYKNIYSKIKLKHDQIHLALLELYGTKSTRIIDFISEDKDHIVGKTVKSTIKSQCPHINPLTFSEAKKQSII